MILIVSFSCLYSFICMVVMPHVALSSFAIIPVWTSMILIASSWHSMINRSCRIHQGRSLMRCRLVLLLPMVACKQTPQKVHLQLSRHRPLFWLSFSLSCVCVWSCRSLQVECFMYMDWVVGAYILIQFDQEGANWKSLLPCGQQDNFTLSAAWNVHHDLGPKDRLCSSCQGWLFWLNLCIATLVLLDWRRWDMLCVCVCVPFQEKLDQHASSNAKAKELLAYSNLFDHHHS